MTNEELKKVVRLKVIEMLKTPTTIFDNPSAYEGYNEALMEVSRLEELQPEDEKR